MEWLHNSLWPIDSIDLSQHWFRQKLVASHYLTQWLLRICAIIQTNSLNTRYGIARNRISKVLCLSIASYSIASVQNISLYNGTFHSVNELQSLIAKFVDLTWGPSGAARTQVGPMFAPWTLLSGTVYYRICCADVSRVHHIRNSSIIRLCCFDIAKINHDIS